MSANKIHVIGISSPALFTDEAEAILRRSKYILTSKRLYELFKEAGRYEDLLKKCKVINKVDDTLKYLKKSRSEVVVLASGDPSFFGIGKRILEVCEASSVKLYPALSSVQLAFASAQLAWEDAYFVSFHGHIKRQWAMGDLPLLCELYPKIAIITGGGNGPTEIAAHLPKDTKVHVLERLGYDDERGRSGNPASIKRMKFREPNLMIVNSPVVDSIAFGLNEDEFSHGRGLITKDEVRAVALHKLRLPRSGVLWDIGAASGSVGIESKRIAPELEVHAIEAVKGRTEDIKKNITKLRAGQINVVLGKAPSALSKLPDPDRVFIGGSGKDLKDVIFASLKRMKKGVIVVSTITLESLDDAKVAFKELGLEAEVTSVSVSRSSMVGGRQYLKALNPIFLIKAVR